MDNNTYSIKDLISLMLSRIWLIIAITVLGGAAGFGYSKLVLPLEYSSHISMYVQSYTGISESANNANNISNSKQLVNTYMEVMKDDAVMNAVGDMLRNQFDEATLKGSFSFSADGKISSSSLRNCIVISSVTDTSAVKVVVTAKNAEIAAAVCNDLTKVAPKYVKEAVDIGSINTIDTAKIYPTPVAPNVPKNTVLGMAAAFMLIVLIIFMIDFFDNTIKDADAVGMKYDKAIIGEIQQFGDVKKKKKNKDDEKRRLLTDKDVPFSVAESYKSIRTNILFTIATSDKKIIAVSSPNPSDGKSTVASNLAIALAQTESKVLLIDADMRKPVQHKTFKAKNSQGLSTLIIQKSKIEKSIKRKVAEGLDLMPSGPMPPNPSELLASNQFKKLLEELSEKYDYIIIDTPPINVVSDAMVMKDNISGIMLVLRYGVTTDEEISDCMKQIDLAKANLLGFVLNGVEYKHRSSYYNYKYKYKDYGYSSEDSDDNKEKSDAD